MRLHTLNILNTYRQIGLGFVFIIVVYLKTDFSALLFIIEPLCSTFCKQ